MRFLSKKAFTIVEILITVAILSVVFLVIYQIFLRGSVTFNERLWEGQITRRLELSAQLIKKYLQAASYPADNTFNGVIRDLSPNFDLLITDGNLSEADAYSFATKNLVGNDTEREDGALEFREYFGSGVNDTHTADSDFSDRLNGSNPEQEILHWTSCRPGYKDMPGFTPAPPRCSRHTLLLKNRQPVHRAADGTYKFYQDLIMETQFSVGSHLTPVNYAKNEGSYAPAWSSSTGGLLDGEKNFVGRRLLSGNIATVVLRVFQKPNDRSRTLELDIIAVSPNYGKAVVRKSFQENVGVKLRK